MSTIYTVNGKVLKNAANDKWLTKKEAPAAFVMDASNAIYALSGGVYNVGWQSPAYPDDYNGNGKQYVLVNNNSVAGGNPLVYSNSTESGGPSAIPPDGMNVLGESTGVLLNNVAVGSGYGMYLVWMNPKNFTTLEEIQAYMANVSITIPEP